MRIYDYLRAETGNGTNESVLLMIKKILFIPSFNAIYLLRRTHCTKSAFIRLLYKNKLAKNYGIFISGHTRIGVGLKFPHPSSIVIGTGTVIGNNVTIYQDCTIGLSKMGQDDYPTIGDNVIIYAGAKIIGGITIGDNSIIAANACVTKSFPANSIIGGVPAKLLKKNELSTIQ